jgi:hypothetical protein
MGTLSNSVLDAALDYISTNCNKAQVVTSASAVLVNSVTLNAGNFGAAADNSGSGGGRKKLCLVSSASDMKSIAVTGSGNAYKVRLLATSTVHVVASIASAPIALTSTDFVNLGTFNVIIRDPL